MGDNNKPHHDHFQLYVSYKKHSLLCLKQFHTKYPDKFMQLLYEMIHVNDNYWVRSGYLIAKYGSETLFRYIAPIIKYDFVMSDGLLHAVVFREDANNILGRLVQVLEMDVVDNHGRSCLFVAHEICFNYLIRHGADVQLQDGLCATEYRRQTWRSSDGEAFFKHYTQKQIEEAIRHVFILQALPYIQNTTITLKEQRRMYLLSIIKVTKLFKPNEKLLALFSDCDDIFGECDAFFTEVYGTASDQRIHFLTTGSQYLLLGTINIKLKCFIAYHELVLTNSHVWGCPNINMIGKCLLEWTAKVDCLEYAKRYLNYGVCKGIQSITQWHFIINWMYVARQDTDIYKDLLWQLVTLRDTMGHNTMLHIIGNYGTSDHYKPKLLVDAEWIKQCLKAGADVNALNNKRRIPLHEALDSHYWKFKADFNLCELLKDENSHLDAIDIYGFKVVYLWNRYYKPAIEAPISLQCLCARACTMIEKQVKKYPKRIQHFIQMHQHHEEDVLLAEPLFDFLMML